MDHIKRRIKIMAVMFCLALVLTVLAACGESVRLPSPNNLQIKGAALTWDEVENASGYVVYFENVEHETEQNRYDLSSLTEPGTYAIEVMALGDGVKYMDSDWSQVKEYIIEPTVEQSLEFDFHNALKSNYEVVGIGTITSNEIVIPATYNDMPVVAIGWRAFKDNVNLKSVTVSEGINEISLFAFEGCINLESIYLPNSLKDIQKNAFSRTGLKTLDIPDSVDNIPYQIIDNCLNLESIRLSESLPSLGSEFFYNTPKLKSVTLPDSLSIIDDHAFVGSSFESIKIPKNVFHIYKNAFENTHIHSIEFEEGSILEKIDELVFTGCNSLESITIPASVKTIGRDAFSNCANLKSVTFEKNSQLTTLNSLFTNSGITEFTIPKTIKTLGLMAFDGLSTLETVRFEDDSEVTVLPMQLFYRCTNLTTVDFGKNSKIEVIGSFAFGDCSKLVNFNIPRSVTSIDSRAFYNATAMKSIIIPSSVETMGFDVFAGWTEKQTINIEERMEAPEGWSSNWYNKSKAVIVWGFQSK